MIDLLKAHQEKFLFVISGGIQYLIDVFLFALMVLIFGANININIFSRACTGVIGFYLNGYVVFKTLNKKSIVQKFNSTIKFLILLAVMTFVSSYLLSFFVHKSELHFIIAKAAIELILAILSFLIQKNFVYRHKAEAD